jgi:hypothetical protein
MDNRDLEVILKHLAEGKPLETTEQITFMVAFSQYCNSVADLSHDNGKIFFSTVSEIINPEIVREFWNKLVLAGLRLRTEGYATPPTPTMRKDATDRTYHQVMKLGREAANDIMGSWYAQQIRKKAI